MKRFKLLLLSTATTFFVAAGIIGLHSTHVFADTLSDIPGNITKIEAPETVSPSNGQLPNQENGQAPTNFAASRISSDFYIYNIPGVKRVKYGTSGLGRPLYYYKIGNGNKTLFANFAIHGFEDSWAHDGYQLTRIAHQLIEKFNNKNKTSGLNGWSVIIVPCANPDGVLDGWTNNGPGRAQISQKIDLNRDFPTFFKPQYNSRNYTGPHPLGAPEAKDLATLVAKVSRENRNMVLLDTHGWLDMTIGDPQIGRPFINNLGLSRNSGYIPTGHGYFISYGHAEGAEVSLVELPDTKSAAQVDSRNYVGKMYTSMNELMNGGTGFDYINKTGVLKNTNRLNIRSGPTTVGTILGHYNSNDSIHVVGEINGWYKVQKSGIGFAYVSADYVRLTGDGGSISGPSTGGWRDVNGSRYYYNADGVKQIGWLTLNGSVYYLGYDGAMQTGWREIFGERYYFHKDGKQQTGWFEQNGSVYYLGYNGVIQTGWREIFGQKYYFHKDGKQQTGWFEQNGSVYYLGYDGVVTKGFREIFGHDYYFNNNGIQQTGWQNINGCKYYLNGSGIKQIGWFEYNGSIYYLGYDGAMTKGFREIFGHDYYFNNKGIQQTGWQDINGSKYYLNGSGIKQIGWFEQNGSVYYLGYDGVMTKGFREIFGEKYYFNNDGIQQKGWKEINGSKYYFNNSGIMATNTTIDGVKIDANGVAAVVK